MFSQDFIQAAKNAVYLAGGKPASDIKFHYVNDEVILKKLYGDASYKVFYRFTYFDEDYVLVKIPKEAPPSEEIFIPEYTAKTQGHIFAETHLWLHQHVSHTATMFAHDPDYEIFIIENGGDRVLYNDIIQKKLTEEAQQAYYFAAIDWLIALQSQTPYLAEGAFIAARHFGQKALQQELIEFCQYSPVDISKQGQQYFAELAETIAVGPQVIIHRDYQSKNILLNDNAILVVDIQDVCLGSLYYDLASLLFDPYVHLCPVFIDNCLQYFYNRIIQMQYAKVDSVATLKQQTQLCGIQRLFKAAGRYQRISQLKNNDSYLQFYDVAVERALSMMKSMGLYPELSASLMSQNISN